MIFPLEQIHSKIDKIFDVPLVFFENAKTSHDCTTLIFPGWFRKVYQRCPGVKDHFELVFVKFKKLNKKKQNQIIDLYRSSRGVKSILDTITLLYPAVDQIDPTIRSEIKNLFTFLFDQTIGTAIFRQQAGISIDDHYKLFSDNNNVHVCPFCGLETYTLPKIRRAEYDHFLPISLYPWLGVNFANLVPMGDHCNGKKNATNVLYKSYRLKTRRHVWYPYDWIDYSIELNIVSKPTLINMNGIWSVNLIASNPVDQGKIDTWDQIFDIKKQFRESISSFHKRFIDDFILKNNLYGERLTLTRLRLELNKYQNNGIGDERIETMSKLKSIWAEYHKLIADESQLAIFVHLIANSKRRTPLI